MSVSLTVNGVSFDYPQTGDENWGVQATGWATAVTSGMLQKAAGSFTLTAEVDFGATYGAKIAYLKSQTANVASAGWARVARADVISWRNQANSGNLDLGVNSSDVLTFNGEVVPFGLIVNADVDAAAAIAFSKMVALSPSILPVTDASGFIVSSSVTATEAGYLSGLLSNAQVQLTGKLDLAGGTMIGDLILNGTPTTSNQAANKAYVDSIATGLNAKTACRIATTGAGTLASSFENGDTVDGVVIATNDRILIKNQVAQAENGIYTVNASGAPTRATDADAWAELVGAYVFISEGTANTATSWVCNVAAGGTINVTAVTFVQFSASQAYTADGLGLELTGNEFGLELDGTTLSQSASGVKVNEIANTQIAAAAAIAVNKLAAVTASRALVSDGSGFVAASAVTATTLAFLDATSSVQTQLDAKIAKTLTSSTGDMIYASSANTPARLAIGTNGYELDSNGTIPVWTDKKISFTMFQSQTSPITVQTTFTALALSASQEHFGTEVVRTNSTWTFPFTGYYRLEFIAHTDGSARDLGMRLRNTTDSTSAAGTIAFKADSGGLGQSGFLIANISDIAKVYEFQICSSGSGATLTNVTISSVATETWKLTIERLRQP